MTPQTRENIIRCYMRSWSWSFASMVIASRAAPAHQSAPEAGEFDRDADCPICGMNEGCDHSVAERKRAFATQPRDEPASGGERDTSHIAWHSHADFMESALVDPDWQPTRQHYKTAMHWLRQNEKTTRETIAENVELQSKSDFTAGVVAMREAAELVAEEYANRHDRSYSDLMAMSHAQQVRFEGHKYAGKNIAREIRALPDPSPAERK